MSSEEIRLYISGFTAAAGLADTPYNLIGYSMGGALAMLHADHRPDEIHKLVLMAPGFSEFFAAEFRDVLNREPRVRQLLCFSSALSFLVCSFPPFLMRLYAYPALNGCRCKSRGFCEGPNTPQLSCFAIAVEGSSLVHRFEGLIQWTREPKAYRCSANAENVWHPESNRHR